MNSSTPIHDYSLTVRNTLPEIRNIVEAVNVLSLKWEWPSKTVHQLELALEEIVSNIIFYAYADELEHTIDIVFWNYKNKVIIEVIDDGKYFNILEAENNVDTMANVEDRKIGGLGIHILKQIVDGIDYQRLGNKNILRVTKQL